MARHNMVNGVKVIFTPEEETARDEEEAIELAKEPMFNWRRVMAKTDFGMPRYLEDLITANSDFILPEKIKTRYDEKVVLRATKPKE